MAKKSSNTQGNPYHDEGDGKFTSPNGDNGSLKKKISNIKLKPGVDLSGLAQSIKNLDQKAITPAFSSDEVNNNTPLTFPTSIQDAEVQGNRILGLSDVVGYADNTSLEVAHSFNQGLQAVHVDFPKLFEKGKLFIYGTRDPNDKLNTYSKLSKHVSTVNAILDSPIYRKRLQELGLNKYFFAYAMSEGLMSSETDFKSKDKRGVGGFTTATLSRNGSISINSVIKFNTNYASDLKIWNEDYDGAVEIGHFLPIGNKNFAYMAATHELGHHVDNQLVGFMNDSEQTKYNMITRLGRSLLETNNEVSGYAKDNKSEQIAEAFTNVYCRGKDATQHNKNIVNFFKEVYSRIYGG